MQVRSTSSNRRPSLCAGNCVLFPFLSLNSFSILKGKGISIGRVNGFICSIYGTRANLVSRHHWMIETAVLSQIFKRFRSPVALGVAHPAILCSTLPKRLREVSPTFSFPYWADLYADSADQIVDTQLLSNLFQIPHTFFLVCVSEGVWYEFG